MPTICYWKDKIVNGTTISEQAMNIDSAYLCEMAGVERPRTGLSTGRASCLYKGETKESPHDYLIYIDPGEYEDQGYGVRSRTTSSTIRQQTARTPLTII